jgi:hypothetical protein
MTREPRGLVYERLLRVLVPVAETAQVVVRDDWAQSPGVVEGLRRLQRWQLAERRCSQWPGTELTSGEATVISLRFDESCAAELGRAVQGLLDWLHPDAPEDLSLLRGDGSEVLATIAHERDAYMELKAHELAGVTAGFPELWEHFEAA